MFAVENYAEYLSIQTDSTIRNIARLYPYDVFEEDDDDGVKEKTLRGSAVEIADSMKAAYSIDKISVVIDKATVYPHSCPICSSIDITKFKDEDALQFTGSKGGKYRAHYKCNACSLYW